MQVFRYITLPLLQPTILFATVIGLITGLQVFIPQFVMTQGGPVDATLVLTLDIYQTAFVFLDGGKAAAMSVVLFFIIAAGHARPVLALPVAGVRLGHGHEERGNEHPMADASPTDSPISRAACDRSRWGIWLLYVVLIAWARS